MIEIYFDGVLLDENNYISLTQKGQIFDKTFKLGTVVAREFTLETPKSVFIENTKEVVIKYATNDYAHLIIDKIQYNEGGSIPTVKLTLVDKLVNANFYYNNELGETTILNILKDICSKIDVELGSTEFPNSDVLVNFQDNTITAREYLSYIGELAGGFIRIEEDGKLYIRKYSNENVNKLIYSELCEQIILGEKHIIQRVVFDNGLLKFESSSDENLETLYLNSNNPYINNHDEFNNICEQIIGFEFCNINTGNTTILTNAMSGDVLKFTYENVDYYTICQFDTLTFMGVWQGVYKLDVNSEKQEETKIIGYDTKLKALKVIQDRINNKLQIIVSDVSSINQDLINQITATQSMIEQTSNQINNSVIELDGKLSNDIQNIANDLVNNINTLNGDIQYNLSLIKQLANSITSTIKSIGGDNLLRNSVGFAGLDYWETSGNVVTSQDSYTEIHTISGSKFTLSGDSEIKQSFATTNDKQYGVSFKIRHIVNGTANPVYIRVYKTENDYIDVLPVENQNTEYSEFTEFNTFTYVATTINPYIKIINTGDDVLEISDLMVSIGENASWSGYNDEIYGKEHRLDKYGLKLTDLASGNYSETTNNRITMKNNGEVVAELSKNMVLSDSGVFKNKYQIGTLQIVALDENNIIEYI